MVQLFCDSAVSPKPLPRRDESMPPHRNFSTVYGNATDHVQTWTQLERCQEGGKTHFHALCHWSSWQHRRVDCCCKQRARIAIFFLHKKRYEQKEYTMWESTSVEIAKILRLTVIEHGRDWDLSWDYGVLEETLWGDGIVCCILTVVIKYMYVMGSLIS